MKKVLLTFKQRWMVENRDVSAGATRILASFLESKYDAKVLSKSLLSCEIVYEGEPDFETIVLDDIIDRLKTRLPTESDNFLMWEVSDYEESGYDTGLDKFDGGGDDESVDEEAEELKARLRTAIESLASEAKSHSDKEIDKTLERVNALTGASEFKQLAEECVKIAPILKKHDAVDEVFTHQCYLFSGNEGDGLDESTKLFSKLLYQLGMCSFTKPIPVLLKSPAEIKDDPLLPPAFSKPKGSVVTIDISEWISNLDDIKFKKMLATVENTVGRCVVIFITPYLEKSSLEKTHDVLSERFSMRKVSFTPLSNDELKCYAEEFLTQHGYQLEDDALDMVAAKIAQGKNKGHFYGTKTVEKISRELMYQKYLKNVCAGVDDTCIKRSEIAGEPPLHSGSEKFGIELFDNLIGMDSVKEQVESIIAQVEMAMKNDRLEAPCIHMRFVGNPGTGKTTTARIVGKILRSKGILRNGGFHEKTRRDLCGQYIGETAAKTSAVCRDAYGSVLFIDEAYSLYRGDDKSRDYGREAIDTLVTEMENHRSDLVVIMAGYPDEMDTLMKANPGLENRMPYTVEFPNYTRDQLYEIFILMAREGFDFDNRFEDAARAYFNSLPREMIEDKHFGNGRFVRNLYERTWNKAALRISRNGGDPNVLVEEDFVQASADKEFKTEKKEKRTLGFI